jgi:hypothetical protein
MTEIRTYQKRRGGIVTFVDRVADWGQDALDIAAEHALPLDLVHCMLCRVFAVGLSGTATPMTIHCKPLKPLPFLPSFKPIERTAGWMV